eukprot:CAMPEP_0174250350 /NCGR_PEP_ID=MMETSP0439-20130205/547_1 /TAXON_ID=0 /ORGANISM="Stereomyxa ramosa, Strain Chinc5" /LENGTH=324 /DNA_ID=CAMNT_0015330387 /DNA_START=45 /DNA_END=1016 /DNA_ORIENTATION=+
MSEGEEEKRSVKDLQASLFGGGGPMRGSGTQIPRGRGGPGRGGRGAIFALRNKLNSPSESPTLPDRGSSDAPGGRGGRGRGISALQNQLSLNLGAPRGGGGRSKSVIVRGSGGIRALQGRLGNSKGGGLFGGGPPPGMGGFNPFGGPAPSIAELKKQKEARERAERGEEPENEGDSPAMPSIQVQESEPIEASTSITHLQKLRPQSPGRMPVQFPVPHPNSMIEGWTPPEGSMVGSKDTAGAKKTSKSLRIRRQRASTGNVPTSTSTSVHSMLQARMKLKAEREKLEEQKQAETSEEVPEEQPEVSEEVPEEQSEVSEEIPEEQ